MSGIEGIWRLVESRAWDKDGVPLHPPYGAHPLGEIIFSRGRMLAALCNGDEALKSNVRRAYSSYGGLYTFDGTTLEVAVDMASDPTRVGGRQVRGVEFLDQRRIVLRPPQRLYGESVERRELIWEQVIAF